ncbi:MAG: SGNH/GDSL hydrolase family protein [Lentisphaeria bacterium]|nr:SGNH/GDSL hydrolase family protein [Lentisphaeria bacterium]
MDWKKFLTALIIAASLGWTLFAAAAQQDNSGKNRSQFNKNIKNNNKVSVMDIEKIDRYMARSKVDRSGLEFYDPRNGKFTVEGLYWFDAEKRYHRFPESAENSVPAAVNELAGCTAGAQIRFVTDSRRIVISARIRSVKSSATMAETGRSGFDLYCGKPGEDEEFWNTVRPVPGEAVFVDEVFTVKDNKMRHFRLNFPLYNGVEELFIGLEKSSEILPSEPLKDSRPIVIYGTSITQGGCASRPGSAFTNILSRKLQMEFLNFGFSGNGQNHLETAEILATIKNPAMFIMDSEANSISGKLINERVPRFLDMIRKAYPDIPILVLSKIPYGQRYAAELPSLKEEFRAIVEQKKAAGDKNIHFVDGSDFFDARDYSENTVDGAHPTDRGFAQMAQKLEVILRKFFP